MPLLQQPVVHDHQQEALPQQEQAQLLLAQQELELAPVLVQQLEEQVVRHNQHVLNLQHLQLIIVLMVYLWADEQMRMVV